MGSSGAWRRIWRARRDRAHKDDRPSWPVEQIAQLLPNAALMMIAGADDHMWVTHAEEMRAALRDFAQRITEHAP
jgi:hypothetical protein